MNCTDCKKFMWCVKNAEEWSNAKRTYYTDEECLKYINAVFRKCEGKVV